MLNSPYVTAAAVATAGLLGGACYAYHLYQQHPAKLPEEWSHVGTLRNMYAYPVKSCGAVVLEEAECSVLGVRNSWLRDRVLMVVDDKNKFISARGYPEMLLVQPTVRGSVLTLKHQDMEDVHVNLAEVVALQKPSTAYVWSVPVPVLDCGWEISEWFSRLLHRETHSLRVVYYASQHARQLRETTNKVYKYGKNDTGALPDEAPFNLINEASVTDLNTRLAGCRVTHRNFRPNFVLEGTAKPYDEDGWRYVKIGENVFEIIKPCMRCVLTTIDPETGIRNGQAEPLTTLKGYRQMSDPEVRRSTGNSPRMGVQMALRSGSGRLVKLNDDIYVA